MIGFAYLPLVLALVPTVTLRNTIKMPLVGAGVFQYNETQGYDSVRAALKAGFTSIDTALDYWNQEVRYRPPSDHTGLPSSS